MSYLRYLPLLLLISLIIAISGCVGNNTFNQGKVSFQIPSDWGSQQITGDFNSTVFSEVTFTANLKDSAGNIYPAYISLEMRKNIGNNTNLPNLQLSMGNDTNSSVKTINQEGLTAQEWYKSDKDTTLKILAFNTGNYLYILEYVCPTPVSNQVEEAYQKIIESIKIQ